MCLIRMKTIHYLNVFFVETIVTLCLEYVHNLFMYISSIILLYPLTEG